MRGDFHCMNQMLTEWISLMSIVKRVGLVLFGIIISKQKCRAILNLDFPLYIAPYQKIKVLVMCVYINPSHLNASLVKEKGFAV